jgi:hypothetical protein
MIRLWKVSSTAIVWNQEYVPHSNMGVASPLLEWVKRILFLYCKEIPWRWHLGVETRRYFSICHELYFVKYICWSVCLIIRICNVWRTWNCQNLPGFYFTWASRTMDCLTVPSNTVVLSWSWRKNAFLEVSRFIEYWILSLSRLHSSAYKWVCLYGRL